MLILTMFLRNFLGVHTPQDVIVEMISTFVMIFISYRIEDWTDKDIKRDLYVLIGGVALCIALALFYHLKSYPLTYNDDGTLLIDPAKMIVVPRIMQRIAIRSKKEDYDENNNN